MSVWTVFWGTWIVLMKFPRKIKYAYLVMDAFYSSGDLLPRCEKSQSLLERFSSMKVFLAVSSWRNCFEYESGVKTV